MTPSTTSSRFQAHPDDVFVFFSDGILDATNKAGDLFGRTRLEKIITEQCASSAEAMVKAIFKAVAEHARGVETFDDQTVVVIKVKGSAAKTQVSELPFLLRPAPSAGRGRVERPPGFTYQSSSGKRDSARQAVLRCEQVPLLAIGGTLWHASVRLFSGDDSGAGACFSEGISRGGAFHLLFGEGEFESQHSAVAGKTGVRIRCGFGRRTGARAAGGPAGGEASCVFGSRARRRRRSKRRLRREFCCSIWRARRNWTRWRGVRRNASARRRLRFG